jgi:hypothetical protein
MTDNEIFGFVGSVLRSHPESLATLRQFAGKATASGSPVPGPSAEPRQAPGWCVCGMCRPMATDKEKKCCRQKSCISLQRHIKNVTIDTDVLRAAVN